MKSAVLSAEIANMNSKLPDASVNSITMKKRLMKAEANTVPNQSRHPNSTDRERGCERCPKREIPWPSTDWLLSSSIKGALQHSCSTSLLGFVKELYTFRITELLMPPCEAKRIMNCSSQETISNWTWKGVFNQIFLSKITSDYLFQCQQCNKVPGFLTFSQI